MLILNRILIIISCLSFVLCLLLQFNETRTFQKYPLLTAILKPHAFYGIILLFSSFFHGILSGKTPGMLTGKTAWTVLLVLVLFSAARKHISRIRWMKIHKTLSLLLSLLILLHILSQYSFSVI